MKTEIIHNGIPQAMEYGTYTPKYFYPVDNSIWRHDEYRNYKTGEVSGDGILTHGLNDLSPQQEKREYLDKCHCCFANYAHTENAHNNAIK